MYMYIYIYIYIYCILLKIIMVAMCTVVCVNPLTPSVRYCSQFGVQVSAPSGVLYVRRSAIFFARYERLDDSLSSDATGVSAFSLEGSQFAVENFDFFLQFAYR